MQKIRTFLYPICYNIKMDSIRVLEKLKRKEFKLTQEELTSNAGVCLRFCHNLKKLIKAKLLSFF